MAVLPVLLQTVAQVDVVNAVNRFADFLLQYAGALAAVGALSMALIEFGKKLLDSRTKFQALRWIEWVKRREFETTLPVETLTLAAAASPRPPGQHEALSELLQLCTGVSQREAAAAAASLLEKNGHLPLRHAWNPEPAHAVFALDLPRMMGSIQDAADVALSTPHRYPSLYLWATAGADADDVEEWLRTGPVAIAVDDTGPAEQQRLHVKEQAERFARLRQIVKRKLDGYQLYTGERWASWNQFAANVVGSIVMFCTLISLRWPTPGPTGMGDFLGTVLQLTTVTIVMLSLLGGILSPVAKDLVSALKRVKDG